ncbi:fluoride efflux transporter FluC [Alicyclobacillus kakegawensis]|uniref:fluoride efflux transporter FluC n=1 Tax=Alicyclobacillus kakegawensis TaxID=392012 RepID=UPI000835F25C|nr:CrcB family protein [Alicyclobacillus kakegawensis]
MTMLTPLLVSIGAAIGSLSRYGIGHVVDQRTQSEFPWGTWTVNLLGTLLLGVFFEELEKVHHAPDWWTLLGTGFCGGFTTFSTMVFEAMERLKSRPVMTGVYLGSSFLGGLLLVWSIQHVG